jgi:hypothetical protein
MSKNKLTFIFEVQFFIVAFSLLRCLTTSLVKFQHVFKIQPCISCFIKRTPMQFPCFKAYFLEVTSHWGTLKKNFNQNYLSHQTSSLESKFQG